MNTFETFSLMPQIKHSLDQLGFTKPTPIQAQIIPLLLENYAQDVHAQAQTGTGKTLAFGIPLLQAIDPRVKKVQGLILAPTRELVLQIYESLKDVSRDTGIRIEAIYGGMPITRQIDALKRGVHIVVGTPGRINDHLRRKTLKLSDLKVLVLDEADIMLDMGFRQEIDQVLELAPKSRNIWLFSATVMSGIKKLIKSHMKNVLSVRSAKGSGATQQVTQYYCIVPERKKIDATMRFIEAAAAFKGIVFCRTKALCIEVTEELASKGIKVNSLHGDMKQTVRNHVIKGFRGGDFTVLVATDVAARGIDVSDLTHVINYSIPDEYESYIHRIGRTGRAGKTGIAILLVTPSQMGRMKKLERVTNAKLMEISMPTAQAIINAKMEGISDFIENAKPILKDSPYDDALKKIIDSFDPEQIRGALQVALKDKFFSAAKGKQLEGVSGSSVRQEICLDLGTEKNISEEEVRGYLYKTCKLIPDEITKVRVLKSHTFISVPENRLENCLALIRKKPLKKNMRAYLVEDNYGSGSGKKRQKRPHRMAHNRRRRR